LYETSVMLEPSGRGVVQAADVAVPREVLAEIGEPEIALLVEHDVVRPRQAIAVHALDAAGRVILRGAGGHEQAIPLPPLETAVVADIHGPVRTDGGAVGPSAKVRDNLGPAVPRASQRAARDLDEDHQAILHGDRTFGKLQSLRHDFEVQEASRPIGLRRALAQQRSPTAGTLIQDVRCGQNSLERNHEDSKTRRTSLKLLRAFASSRCICSKASGNAQSDPG
jgi:hypothetical protein